MLAEGSARRSHRGRARIRCGQLWVLGMGEAERSPFVPPVPFLVLSRRGSSQLSRGWDIDPGLCKRSWKAAVA